MLDPHLFRTDLEFVTEQLKKRNFAFNPENYSELEARRKSVQTKTQELQNARNSSSKAIGQAKAKGEDVQLLLDQVANFGDELKAAETELSEIQNELDTLMSGIPNLLDLSVPEGKSEDDNLEISRWGDLPMFDFEVKDHVDLGTSRNLLDFELGAKLQAHVSWY